MILTLTVLGRQVLAVHLGAPPQEPPPEMPPRPPACDRPHREPPGFVGGSSLRADLGPRRWPEVSA